MRFRPSSLLRLVLILALPPVASAATRYVNGVSGSNTNNCLSATTACKTIGHAISLSAAGDTIRVAAATYAGPLTIPFNLNLIGAGAPTTIIQGGHPVVDISAGANVTLSNLQIRKGVSSSFSGSGGGIKNFGTLTLIRAIVSSNTATNKGGGIYNAGTLIISNSTLSGNGAGGLCPPNCGADGGGIYNAGTLIIDNSTLSGNGASSCHFILCSGEGGGIYNTNTGRLTISSSTLSGNSSPGPGGGILNDAGTAILQNSIVANNSDNCYDVTSHGYNLSSDDTCGFSGPGDMNNIDPKLGILGNYGGPTQTIPLLAGSPAIDGGNPDGCTDGFGHQLKTDQRGMPRPDKEDASGCDSGAYERQSD